MNYDGAKILAPMVRIGTLPARLLALDHGADIVYCEEIIDFKLLQCKRVVNDLLDTVDFLWSDGTVVFRTCARERSKVVLQIGTADAERALTAARLVENDVSAIDVNMGCPKEYSTKGGMGAALLQQPDKIKAILTTLVQGLSIPVSCKIRVLDTVEDTVSLAQMIENTGVAALAVHGRMRDERPRHWCRNDVIAAVAQAVSIPVIANGGSKQQIARHADIETFRASCGAAAVMVARSAQWNSSLFSPGPLRPIDDVIKDYLKYAVEYDNPVMNTKYNVQQMYHEHLDSDHGRQLLASGLPQEIYALWGMSKYYEEALAQQQWKAEGLQLRTETGEAFIHGRTLDDGTSLFEAAVTYNRREYDDNKSPKMILYCWCMGRGVPAPTYLTTSHTSDQMFDSVLTLEGCRYSSTIWDKSKKNVEQAAAVIALRSLGLDTGRRTDIVNDKPCSKLVMDIKSGVQNADTRGKVDFSVDGLQNHEPCTKKMKVDDCPMNENYNIYRIAEKRS